MTDLVMTIGFCCCASLAIPTGLKVFAVDFDGTNTLIVTLDIMGILALATFFGFVNGVALSGWGTICGGPFLTLNNGAVVDVPQSEQLSLYSGRRRPHFRQNGNIFTLIFYIIDGIATFKL